MKNANHGTCPGVTLFPSAITCSTIPTSVSSAGFILNCVASRFANLTIWTIKNAKTLPVKLISFTTKKVRISCFYFFNQTCFLACIFLFVLLVPIFLFQPHPQSSCQEVAVGLCSAYFFAFATSCIYD